MGAAGAAMSPSCTLSNLYKSNVFSYQKRTFGNDCLSAFNSHPCKVESQQAVIVDLESLTSYQCFPMPLW